MLNHPLVDPHNPILNKNPLDLKYIQSYKEKDSELTKALKEDTNFITFSIRDIALIHHKKNELERPKIVIPYVIQYATIR